MKIKKNSQKLLIAIDIGNSRTSYGVFLGGALKSVGCTSGDNIPKIVNIIDRSGVNINSISCIISSVVPQIKHKLIKSVLQLIPRRSVYIVGKDIFPKVRMKYNHRQLGTDRLVNVYGAIERYKLPM